MPLPPKLFSHNDQQSVWQSSLPEGATSGWGGRIGDQFLSSNATATFTCVNVSGNAVFMSGQQRGAVPGRAAAARWRSRPRSRALYGSQACSDALKALITAAPRANLFENELATIMNRADPAPRRSCRRPWPAPRPDHVFDSANPLAMQLQDGGAHDRRALGAGRRRQVFFVSLGGFDNHDFLPQQHPGLLAQVSGARRRASTTPRWSSASPTR